MMINGDGSIKKAEEEKKSRNSENCPFRKVFVEKIRFLGI